MRGVIAELGPGAPDGLAIGDRVMVHHYWGCGVCEPSRAVCSLESTPCPNPSLCQPQAVVKSRTVAQRYLTSITVE